MDGEKEWRKFTNGLGKKSDFGQKQWSRFYNGKWWSYERQRRGIKRG